MKKIFLFFLFVSCTFLSFIHIPEARANNLEISNVVLDHSLYEADQNVKAYYIDLDLSIYNSWRDDAAPSPTANWDAGWVFAKYSVWNDNTETWTNWAHCTLSKTGHTAPVGSTIDVGCSPNQDCTDAANTGVGAFIYRDATGSGKFEASGVKLYWDYSNEANVNLIDANAVQVKVFGTEMVYIPEGPFFVGDPNCDATHGPTACFYKYGCDSTAVEDCSFEITSDDTILAGATAGKLYAKAAPFPSGDIPASYPVGYNAFYMMKYELTQAQYRDFLNTLTRAQQNSRTASQGVNQYAMSNYAAVLSGQTIRNPAVVNTTDLIIFGCDGDGDGVFDEANDGEWRAMNYVADSDFRAYAAWAGLRPSTEFEFIKAARGPKRAVVNEYAWGTTSITNAVGLANEQTFSESVTSGNVLYSATGSYQYPLRVGIFATSASTRVAAGAGYYGNMELSGNLFDSFYNVTQTGFIANHGQGTLSSPSGWAGTLYYGFGGSWTYDATYARVADRVYADSAASSRLGSVGVRCARTSP